MESETLTLLDELEVRMSNLQTLALVLPMPKVREPESRDRAAYDRACIETIAWQARKIRELAAPTQETSTGKVKPGIHTCSPLRDGVACGRRPACLSHVTEPCEGCGRIAGKSASHHQEGGVSDEFGWLPAHKCGLYLEHNVHRDVYESVDSYYRDEADAWVSEDERLRAVENDEVWSLQWYPATPVGFCRLLASSLDAIKAYLEAERI